MTNVMANKFDFTDKTRTVCLEIGYNVRKTPDFVMKSGVSVELVT